MAGSKFSWLTTSAARQPSMYRRGIVAAEDLLDFAMVNVEFTGYRLLAVASMVPRSYRLFQERTRQWHTLARRRHTQARYGLGETPSAGPMSGSDEQHEKFVLWGSERRKLDIVVVRTGRSLINFPQAVRADTVY